MNLQQNILRAKIMSSIRATVWSSAWDIVAGPVWNSIREGSNRFSWDYVRDSVRQPVNAPQNPPALHSIGVLVSVAIEIYDLKHN